MGKVFVTESYLDDIADAIREKNSSENEYTPAQMAGAIEALHTYTASDEGKVVDNGVLVAQGSDTVTENDTYDTTLISSLTVNVEGGGGGSADDWTALKNYIESSGTQYINTGYSVQDDSKFEVIANPSTSQTTYATIFGTRASNDDYSSSQSCILATAWASDLGNVNWGSGINRLTSASRGNKTKYVVSKTHGIALLAESLDEIIGYTSIDSTYSATTASLMIFTLGINGADYGSVTHCNMKLYRFRIYESDTLVHEYVPWTDTSDIVCLKDTVTGDLLYNAGTGTFTYGTDT